MCIHMNQIGVSALMVGDNLRHNIYENNVILSGTVSFKDY